MNYKSSAELKRLAKGQLKGKYGISIGVLLLYFLIIFAIVIAISIFSLLLSPTGVIMKGILYLLLLLAAPIFAVGLTRFYLILARGEELSVSNLFWGFSNHPGKYIIVYLLVLIFSFIIFIPVIILCIINSLHDSSIFLTLTILYYIVTYVFLIIWELSISQVYNLLADDPEKSVIQVLKESRALMKGHKGRLFYMIISFLGWYVLGICSCGIGFLWIIPYFYTTLAIFYLDMIGEHRFKEQDAYSLEKSDSNNL